jgi:NhaP-type Na+/H+ or K+/H+ antiporter
MEVDVERQVNYYVWKIIFPLCLIVIMSWIPRWINPEQIGANVEIATTSFLTLVAYLFAVAHLLPRISYFTRMDQFILLSTLMVFISLLQTVATSTLILRETPPPLARVDRWSRIVYRVILLAVLGISFRL